jgi:phage-related protein
MSDGKGRKTLLWVGSSREDLSSFPEEVKYRVGFALHLAQTGRKHPHAKPLKGYKGAGVLEVCEDHAGDTYRAVYTVRFAELVYVLHAFQKKAKHGIATPARELELVAQRLMMAEMDYEQRSKERK